MMSSTSSSFVNQINTKYEAWRLIHDPVRLFVLLYSKYGEIEEDLYLTYANQLIFNLPTKLNCFFKEIKYSNIIDYLKRSYKIKESLIRIPKLSDYYKKIIIKKVKIISLWKKKKILLIKIPLCLLIHLIM